MIYSHEKIEYVR